MACLRDITMICANLAHKNLRVRISCFITNNSFCDIQPSVRVSSIYESLVWHISVRVQRCHCSCNAWIGIASIQNGLQEGYLQRNASIADTLWTATNKYRWDPCHDNSVLIKHLGYISFKLFQRCPYRGFNCTASYINITQLAVQSKPLLELPSKALEGTELVNNNTNYSQSCHTSII